MSLTPAAEGLLPSPCVGICRLDPATGWCLGCARDADELARWRDLQPEAQAEIWAELPRRKAILGLAFRLRPWSGPALLDQLERLAREPGTGWSIGVYGAVAEFATRDGEAPEVEIGGHGLQLRTTGGALRLCPPAGTRAFELVGSTGRVERLVLALHRSRLRETPAVAVTELGADAEAIEPRYRSDRLFDLGVTHAATRFCVRTDAPALLAALREAEGRDALDPATGPLSLPLAGSPDRVVISAMGRVEVSGPILRTDHAGPHTHLLPQLLAQGRELEPGFELPEGYVAGVSIFPVGARGDCTAP